MNNNIKILLQYVETFLFLLIQIIKMHLHFRWPSAEWEKHNNVQITLYNLVMEPNSILYSAQSCLVS